MMTSPKRSSRVETDSPIGGFLRKARRVLLPFGFSAAQVYELEYTVFWVTPRKGDTEKPPFYQDGISRTAYQNGKIKSR
jgi:hypothetical protein